MKFKFQREHNKTVKAAEKKSLKEAAKRAKMNSRPWKDNNRILFTEKTREDIRSALIDVLKENHKNISDTSLLDRFECYIFNIQYDEYMDELLYLPEYLEELLSRARQESDDSKRR